MVLLQPDPFLSELTSMFECSTEQGSVWVILKRSSLKSKVQRSKMKTAGEFIEYRCLVRATDGKKTISTSDKLISNGWHAGVHGVGPVTAVKLITKFGTLENLLQNVDQVESEETRKDDGVKFTTLLNAMSAYAEGSSADGIIRKAWALWKMPEER